MLINANRAAPIDLRDTCLALDWLLTGDEGISARMSFSARRGRMVLLALLALATLINIAQFGRIDRNRSVFDKAVYRFDTADIIVLGLRMGNIRNTTNLYGALRQIAPGVTLIVPKDRGVSRKFVSSVVAFSRAKLVRREISPLPDPSSFAGSIVARGEIWRSPKRAREGKPGDKWAIATGHCPAKEMLVLSNDSFDYFLLDTSLLRPDQTAACPTR